MPVSTPRKGESKKDFIDRCTAEEIVRGVQPDKAEAICYDTWEEEKGDD